MLRPTEAVHQTSSDVCCLVRASLSGCIVTAAVSASTVLMRMTVVSESFTSTTLTVVRHFIHLVMLQFTTVIN